MDNEAVIKTVQGQRIFWRECHEDAEQGDVVCGSHCAECVGSDFRKECLTARQEG